VKDGVVTVIGLMSGTSLDGVDAALLETDGEGFARPGAALTWPYAPELRALLRQALDDAARATPGASPQSVSDAEARLTQIHAEAVRALMAQARMAPADLALIGFHGQTVLHRPAEHRTWQIGDGAALARATGIPVVNDFRSADVAAGGQGAPLVPLYHSALAQRFEKPIAVLNIGGVANVTYVDGDTILAFDTGPGNAPVDDWALRHTGEPVDRDGKLARAGKVDESVLTAMLAHEYFDRCPPKSLDRLDFGTAAVSALSPEDGAATLTAFTCAAIARAAEFFPKPVTRWIVCGGGRHNAELMRCLRARLKAPVMSAEDVEWRGDFLEAEAFAYLAVRSVRGLPLSLPSTTGVPSALTGGRMHRVA
jgi:anhydro-N-acetylmuramic acid kinase